MCLIFIIFYIIIFLVLFFHVMKKEKRKKLMALARKNFNLWCKLVETGDVESLVKLYGKKPDLLATFEEMVRTRKGVRKYFAELSTLNPKVKLWAGSENVEWVCASKSSFKHSGIYQFETSKGTIRARFTFTWKAGKKRKKWRVCSHHSSESPKKH